MWHKLREYIIQLLSAIIFVFTELLCPLPPTISGSTGPMPPDRKAPNTVLTYTCKHGYTYPDDTVEQNITCREISPTSANWTEPKHAGCIGNGTILFSLQPSFPTMHSID